MGPIISNFLITFAGFFAIMNPIANTPIFISLTAADNPATRKTIAFKSLMLAFLIILFFCLLGKFVFTLFGITLPALRITGGLVVFLIGFHMLQGSASKVHTPEPEDNQESLEAELSIIVSPLAVPILAGPGTIATAMQYSSQNGLFGIITTIAAFAILCIVTYLFFVFGERFVNYIGESAIKGISRLMGLLLAVIGSQMVIEGIYGAVRLYSNSGT